MLVQSQPLSLRRDVTFFRRAKRISTPQFLLYWEALSSDTRNQLSVIIPKHHIKTSVKRHQLKRRVKNCVARTGLVSHLNLVFVVNRKAAELTFAELREKILLILQQLSKPVSPTTSLARVTSITK